MNNLITRYDARDWQLGDSHVRMKATGSPDWTNNMWFNELQKIGGFETECCVIFSMQESFDAQVDRMIQKGEVSATTLAWFTAHGYMDSVNSSDGKPHFHTSERFIAYNTGNGFNGNALQDPWIAAQKYGMVPWSDWPFDATVSQADYFNNPPQEVFDKGILFLAAIGGKNSIQYHWIFQGTNASRSVMDSARQTAPLCIGVATNDGWNQLEPTPASGGANHSIGNHNVIPDSNTYGGEVCRDHYLPIDKILISAYPIPQVMQGVVSIIPPPPAPPAPVPTPATPTSPAQPVTVKQTLSWLALVSSWLSSILETITPTGRARLQGASRSDQWPAFKKEYALTHLPVCAICGGTAQLNLHHLRPFHVFPELELDPTNVVWLCNAKLCHIRVGHLSNFSSINPNGAADIVIWRDKIRNRPNTPQEIKADFNQ